MNLPKLTQRHGVGKCSWKNDTSKGFPCGSLGKESTCNILTWLGRSPGGGHGSPLQYSFLENPHGQKSLVGYSPLGHKVSDTTEQLRTDLTQSCHKSSICKIQNIVEAQSINVWFKKKTKRKSVRIVRKELTEAKEWILFHIQRREDIPPRPIETRRRKRPWETHNINIKIERG